LGIDAAGLGGLGELNIEPSSGDGKKFALNPHPAIAVRGY